MALFEEALTYSVIGGFLTTNRKLAAGYLENVYIGGLVIELERRGHHVEREVPIAVHYDDGTIIGSYRVDLLVDRRLIVEVKAEPGPQGAYERQLRNYLTCTEFELGLLLVFGERPFHKRIIHNRRFKKWMAPCSCPSPPCNSVETAEPRSIQAPNRDPSS